MFGARLATEKVTTSGGVLWYRRWQEEFYYRALKPGVQEADEGSIPSRSSSGGPVLREAWYVARTCAPSMARLNWCDAHTAQSSMSSWTCGQHLPRTATGRVPSFATTSKRCSTDESAAHGFQALTDIADVVRCYRERCPRVRSDGINTENRRLMDHCPTGRMLPWHEVTLWVLLVRLVIQTDLRPIDLVL